MVRKKTIGTFLSALVLGTASVFGQNQPQQQTPDDSGMQGQATLEDILLNDFENAEDWRAFSTCPLGETKTRKVIQQGAIEDVFNPQELTAEEKERFKPGVNHVLGVKGYFKDRGFDRIEVKPPHEYIIKGLGRQLSLWVLGRNFRHTLYVKLRDYKGNLHKLRLGRLNFLGWRKLTLTVPGWLPQSTKFALLDKNLHFVSLYVESDPHEVGGEYYFYVDDLRIKVDKSEMTYPGSLIKDNW
ncbi:MAG: flagellar filament outer layer protein FlaA [Leptospiraceae bacterium]|nr:flagellar filament outer layer protein FlaA [Leptospiraceae bacterium]